MTDSPFFWLGLAVIIAVALLWLAAPRGKS